MRADASPSPAHGLPDPGDYRHVLRYDPAGNRLSKRIDAGNDGSIDQVTACRYNARDQLVLEWIDANDNGLPDEATVTSCGYDANGSATGKRTETAILDEQGQPAVRIDRDDTCTWDLRGRSNSGTADERRCTQINCLYLYYYPSDSSHAEKIPFPSSLRRFVAPSLRRFVA